MASTLPESWLNNSVNNDKRGQALSLYMIVQMIGIVSAQGVLAIGNPNGYSLFIIISYLYPSLLHDFVIRKSHLLLLSVQNL